MKTIIFQIPDDFDDALITNMNDLCQLLQHEGVTLNHTLINKSLATVTVELSDTDNEGGGDMPADEVTVELPAVDQSVSLESEQIVEPATIPTEDDEVVPLTPVPQRCTIMSLATDCIIPIEFSDEQTSKLQVHSAELENECVKFSCGGNQYTFYTEKNLSANTNTITNIDPALTPMSIRLAIAFNEQPPVGCLISVEGGHDEEKIIIGKDLAHIVSNTNGVEISDGQIST